MADDAVPIERPPSNSFRKVALFANRTADRSVELVPQSGVVRQSYRGQIELVGRCLLFHGVVPAAPALLLLFASALAGPLVAPKTPSSSAFAAAPPPLLPVVAARRFRLDPSQFAEAAHVAEHDLPTPQYVLLAQPDRGMARAVPSLVTLARVDPVGIDQLGVRRGHARRCFES